MLPAGPPVAYVRQKKFALKEDIRFYADEGETQELFRIAARSVLDIGGSRYDVLAGGERIGFLWHKFKESLIRTTWHVGGPNEEELALARERSLVGAVLRRVIDFVEKPAQPASDLTCPPFYVFPPSALALLPGAAHARGGGHASHRSATPPSHMQPTHAPTAGLPGAQPSSGSPGGTLHRRLEVPGANSTEAPATAVAIVGAVRATTGVAL